MSSNWQQPEISRTRNRIEVTAAVIRQNGKILICSRPADCSLAGYWEFPGGKVHQGETDAEGLKREIREELGVDIIVLDQVFVIRHDYPDKKVEIRFYRCSLQSPSAQLTPLDKQQIRWVTPSELPAANLLPADAPLADFLS